MESLNSSVPLRCGEITLPRNGSLNLLAASLEEISCSVAPLSSARSRSLPPLAVAILSCQVLFSLLILTSNLAVIVVFVCRRSLFRSIGKFVFILACVDLCTGFSVIFQTLFFFYPSLSANKWACLMRFQFVVCLTLLSLVTLLLISFERFLSVAHVEVFRRYKDRGMWAWILGGLWGYVLLIFLCPLLGWNNWDGKTKCHFPLVMRREQMLWGAITTWLTSVFVVIMYTYILSVVKRKLSQVSVTRESQGSPGSDNVNHFGNNSQGMTPSLANIRTIKVAVVMTLAFSLCWIPYSVIQLYHFLYAWHSTQTMVGDVLVFLGISNSFMNPFIYIWMKKEFRKFFFSVFWCRT